MFREMECSSNREANIVQDCHILTLLVSQPEYKPGGKEQNKKQEHSSKVGELFPTESSLWQLFLNSPDEGIA